MFKLWPFCFLVFGLFASEWNFKNNPFFKGSMALETKFELLPQSFELSGLFGTHWIWPIKEGGILNRWALKNPVKPSDKYHFSFFPIESLKNVDIAQLSPAEKFDLYLGNANWNFSKTVKRDQALLREVDLKEQIAFSELVLSFKNPSSIVLEGKSNLKIPFSSSDISALLFSAILLGENTKERIVGQPCKVLFVKETDAEKCEGINAGAFHVLLTNFIGLRDQGLFADLKRDKNMEIRPIIGFVSNFKNIEDASSSKKELLVTTFIKFLRPRTPQWSFEPTNSSRGYESYSYTLELDNDNNIIGGKWISFNRPDFIVLKNSEKMQGIFQDLGFIYQKSTTLTLDSDLKYKGFAQKEVLLDLIKNNISPESTNLMFEDFFTSYKAQLIQKKSTKKFARARLSRELKLTKNSLLQKINAVKIGPSFRMLSSKFINLARSNGELAELKKTQKAFLDFARRNYLHPDLPNLGKIAYLQQKFLDDYLEEKGPDYNRFDYLEKYFLLEPKIFNESEMLTSSKNFLEGANVFIKSLKKQKEELRANLTGKIKIDSLIPTVNLDSKSSLELSFINNVKEQIQRTKNRENKNWKKFLSEDQKISKNKILIPNISEEFKKFKNPRNYVNNKKLYRLSFSLKRLQALKKITSIPQFNNIKEKSEYYQKKFLEESILPKPRNLFLPLSRLESIGFCQKTCFKNGKILEELLDTVKSEVFTYNKGGESLVTAINKNDIKTIEDILKTNNYPLFETESGLNPLLVAVSSGSESAIYNLLSTDFGASINYEDKNGKNALTLGIARGINPEIIKQMTLKGIDLNSRDNLGFFPRDYLKRSNPLDQYLESLGAKLSRH